jgi:hypothetical protein
MIRNFTLLSFVVLACQFSFATVTGVSVIDGTASRVNIVSTSSSDTGSGGTTTPTTTNTYTIFGGYAGDGGECATGTRNNSSTCNSCAGTGAPSDVCTTLPYACAEKSIYPGMALGITMALDKVPPNPAIRIEYGSSTQFLSSTTGTSTSFSDGVPFTVYIKWLDLCNGPGQTGNGDCKTPLSTDLTVGLVDSTGTGTFAAGNSQKFTVKIRYQDPTDATTVVTPTQSPAVTQGFTDFQVLPGDEKVYVRDVWRGTSPGDSSGILWNSLRLYYSEIPAPTSPPTPVDFCSIPLNLDAAHFADLAMTSQSSSGDSTLSQDYITGLTNDVNYMFTAATVDDATIVSNFMHADGNDPAQILRYTAMPGEVVGLLDKKKCFIATAAFGSPMEPHVELLRDFRDQILGRFWLGKKFIRFYYDNSPPLAQFISEHDTLRAMARGILWPIVFFAELALQKGAGFAIAIYAFGILGLAVLIFAVKKGRAWRKA